MFYIYTIQFCTFRHKLHHMAKSSRCLSACLPPVPPLIAPGLSIHHDMGPAELCPDPAEPGHDVLHLAEVVGAKLDSSDVGVLAARDNVLQHLPLAALAVGVQQVHCPVEEFGNILQFFRSSSDLQFFKVLGQIQRILHPKCFLASLVCGGKLHYSGE